MKTIMFFAMCAVVLAFLLWRLRRPPSRSRSAVDVIVPAFNEEGAVGDVVTARRLVLGNDDVRISRQKVGKKQLVRVVFNTLKTSPALT